jgi:hypothetical protein
MRTRAGRTDAAPEPVARPLDLDDRVVVGGILERESTPPPPPRWDRRPRPRLDPLETGLDERREKPFAGQGHTLHHGRGRGDRAPVLDGSVEIVGALQKIATNPRI